MESLQYNTAFTALDKPSDVPLNTSDVCIWSQRLQKGKKIRTPRDCCSYNSFENILEKLSQTKGKKEREIKISEYCRLEEGAARSYLLRTITFLHG